MGRRFLLVGTVIVSVGLLIVSGIFPLTAQDIVFMTNTPAVAVQLFATNTPAASVAPVAASTLADRGARDLYQWVQLPR